MLCPDKPLENQYQAKFFNVNEWIDYAQEKGLRPLERVLVDLKNKIGGTPESKQKMKEGLDVLMQKKYTNTSNPNAKYTEEEGSPKNLEINRQNVVAAANFKNKLDKEVPSNHTTPQDSEVDDSDVD